MTTDLRPFMMFPPGEETDELKRQFAVALLDNPRDPYSAAATFESDPGRAQYIAMNWPNDALVIATMREAFEEGIGGEALPTKEEFALTLWDQARETKSATTKLDYLKLFASVMGYVEKPTEKASVNVAVVNKVMAVPVAAPEDVRSIIRAQQAKLVNAS